MGKHMKDSYEVKYYKSVICFINHSNSDLRKIFAF